MNYDMVRYERGQIWMIRFKHPERETAGREQSKDRPWLILSVGKFNKSSRMFTAVPITTRDEIRSPAQVLFVNERGSNNVILCEQIRTFDYSSGEYLTDFVGVISDEILDKVDVALSIHLGLHYSPITLNTLYSSMESVIKSIGHIHEKSNTPRFTEDDVLDFAIKLQEIASTSEETPSVQEDTIHINIEHPQILKLESPNVPNEKSSTSHRSSSPHRKWTPDKCREFLRDDETMPMKAVMDKWNILKKTRYYSTKNYVRSLLEKMI